MIRIGVAGYGYWGPNVARCLSQVEDARVVTISDRRKEVLAKAAMRHPGTRVTEDFADMLNDPHIDAVAIATPVDTHFDLGMAALRAGKHVWIEKPICQTSEQAARMIDEAGRRSRVLLVDHTFIYTSAVRKIRDLITTGALGDLYYYDSVRINLGLFQRDVNVISDLAVHDFSILDYLVIERPIAVSANGASPVRGTPESMAYVTLFFGSGMIAHLNVNWLAPVKVRQTLIGGSQKMIVFDDLEPSEKVKVYDRGVTLNGSAEQIRQLMIDYRIGDMWSPHLVPKEALQTEAEHFVHCVSSGGAPITDGAMGFRVVELIEAASLSMQQRGHPAELHAVRRAS
jgi:predicted dehydrogenase